MARSVIPISSQEANLKRRIRCHLLTLGFQNVAEGVLEVEDRGKDVIRALHSSQRNARREANRNFLVQRSSALIKYFASGRDIEPANISPRLEKIAAGTWQSDLFRLASMTWSVPVSNGFGRRLRYLVWDENNGKLIGLIAIGDPVFNLSVRDNLIGWNSHDRKERLVNVMDAYVLGALPPYNILLGGKMVACLTRTQKVYKDFMKTYGATVGIISQKQKKARLLAVTTMSSMGRSSVYNRLKLGGTEYFRSIGYTRGWGHFHIPDELFAELRDYLRQIGHPYSDLHRFGAGPNWRLRTTRAALRALGFNDNLLRHGIRREVFICSLASNATKLLRTGKGRPDLSSLLSVGKVARLARERWIVPRSQRRPEYRNWMSDHLIQLFGDHSQIIRTCYSNSGRLIAGDTGR